MRIFTYIGPASLNYPHGTSGDCSRAQINPTGEHSQTKQAEQKNFKKSSQLKFG